MGVGPHYIYIAAQEGFLDVVQLLVESGANVTSSSKSGRKPLHMCAFSGHLDVVNYLLDNELVDVNCTDSKNWTPLHSAANKGHIATIRCLIEKGADINKLISMGRNALHLCSFYGQYTKIAKILLEHEIDFKVHDNEGWTSLHLAAQEGKHEIVKQLLDKGADPSSKARNGQVPLHLAMNGYANIVKLLLSFAHEADIIDNKTSGHLCIQNAIKVIWPQCKNYLSWSKC